MSKKSPGPLLIFAQIERERERVEEMEEVFVVATNVGKMMCDRSAVTDLGVTRVLPTVDLIDSEMLCAWLHILN